MTKRPGHVFTKAAAEVLIYEIDWTSWLPTSVLIASSAWAIRTGDSVLTKDSPVLAESGLTTSIRLSAGTAGKTYELVNTIVTAEVPAQTAEAGFLVRVV